jgi:hypothetical protein
VDIPVAQPVRTTDEKVPAAVTTRERRILRKLDFTTGKDSKRLPLY